MTADGPAGKPAPKPVQGSTTSSWWTMYRDSLKSKFSPFRGAKDPETATARGYSTNALLAASTPYFRIQSMIDGKMFGQGGDPEDVKGVKGGMLGKVEKKADEYMGECVKWGFVRGVGSIGGVYGMRCTEGVSKGEAEDSRVLSVGREFRRKHRDVAKMYGDFFAMRKQALVACGECDYEEKLVLKFPRVARMMVRGKAESLGACVRYSEGGNEEEEFMGRSVDMQMKMRAMTGGVYDVGCMDGQSKGLANYTRVAGLSAKFRAKQYSKGEKERVKFESAKYARDNFGHECGYEEAYFNKYPAVAQAMRPTTARY